MTYAQQDVEHRQQKISVACQKLQAIADKLNRYQLKTREKIQQAVDKALEDVKDYVDSQIIEHTTIVKKQIGRGRVPKLVTRKYLKPVTN